MFHPPRTRYRVICKCTDHTRTANCVKLREDSYTRCVSELIPVPHAGSCGVIKFLIYCRSCTEHGTPNGTNLFRYNLKGFLASHKGFIFRFAFTLRLSLLLYLCDQGPMTILNFNYLKLLFLANKAYLYYLVSITLKKLIY